VRKNKERKNTNQRQLLNKMYVNEYCLFCVSTGPPNTLAAVHVFNQPSEDEVALHEHESKASRVTTVPLRHSTQQAVVNKQSQGRLLGRSAPSCFVPSAHAVASQTEI
jgi:hypothetical protein